MAEEAKDSPGKVGNPPCEYPEGALDLLKKLTDGKPGTRETDGWKTWAEICRSGADSDWYPSRTTDTCDGVTRRLVPCAPRGATKGLILRDSD